MSKRNNPVEFEDVAPKTKSFKSLIGERVDAGAPLSQDGQNMLQEAVLQLVSHHRNLDALISEACQTEGHVRQTQKNKDVPLHHSAQGILAQLEEKARAARTPLASLVATVCAAKLQEITGHDHDDNKNKLLLTEKQRITVDVIIGVIKRTQMNHGFSRNTFIKALNREVELPLELTWILNKEGIMPFEAFITCNLNHPPVIGGFAQTLVQLCQTSGGKNFEERRKILQDCLCWLIGQGYGDRGAEDVASKGMKKVACALLDSITKKVLSQEFLGADLHLFEEVHFGCSQGQLEMPQLKRYCTRQIIVALGLNPVFKVSDAVVQQSKWTFTQSSQNVTTSYKQLFLAFEVDEVVDIIRRVLEQEEVNWQAVLTFVATFLVCFPEAPTFLKGLIVGMLSDGLENADVEAVITAFLLARQACLEGPHIFPAYQDWFQATFGAESYSLAGNKKTFSFLLKFLTDIVPFEPGANLKAHILQTPYVPPKCRPILSDYITLAKTRLADLKEPTDQLGIYDDATSGTNNDQILLQAEQDVQKALNSFDKSSKLPASVMEASIFRKPYFVGRFLPALLTPRPLPDTPDIRMKFIDALHKAEKIPSSLFSAYKKSCRKEAAQLLEGVFSDEDSMEDLLLPPGEQLSHALQMLLEAVISSHQGDKTAGISSSVSVVSEKIHVVLGTEPRPSSCLQPVTIDMSRPFLQSEALMVSDKILNTVCQLMAALEIFPEQNGTWLTQLFTMVNSHSTVLPALLSRMWELLMKQGQLLSSHHISGVAALFLHMVSFPDMMAQVTVKVANHKGLYVDMLLKNLRCNTQIWMEISLRFYTHYLRHALKTFSKFSLVYLDGKQAVIPPDICKKFDYLVMRMCPATLNQTIGSVPGCGSADIQLTKASALDIYRSEVYKNLKKEVALSFEEWVRLEESIQPHEDSMDFVARLGFLEKTICDHYLTLPQSEGGCGGSSRKACTTILDVLMESYQSCNSNAPLHPCRRHCQESRRSYADSKPQLLQVIQHLTSSILCYDSSGEDSTPWLATTLLQKLTLHKQQSPSDVFIENTCNMFFRLARCLSPHLIFCDSLVPRQLKGGYPGVHKVIEIVNEVMRNHLSTGAVLNVYTVRYLLEGLHMLDSASVENDKLVSTIIEKCPVLAASVIVHWSTLNFSCEHLRNGGFMFDFIQDVLKVIKWTSSKNPHVVPNLKLERSHLMLTAGLYMACLRGSRYSLWIRQWSENNVDASTGALHKVPLGCLYFILSHLVEKLMYNKDILAEDILVPTALELMTLTSLPGFNRGSVLDKASEDQVKQLSNQPLFLNKILAMHVACSKLYDIGRVDEDDLDLITSDWPSGLTSQSVEEGVCTIKRLLTKLPQLCAADLDKRLLNQCDPAIQAALKVRGICS